MRLNTSHMYNKITHNILDSTANHPSNLPCHLSDEKLNSVMQALSTVLI